MDQKIGAIQKIVYHSSSKDGVTLCHEEPSRKHWGQAPGKEKREKLRATVFIVVTTPGKKMMRQNKQV